MDQDFKIRAARVDDRSWIEELILERWGAFTVAVHDTLYIPADLAAFIGESAPDSVPGSIEKSGGGVARVGLVTYVIDGGDCEIVTLDSLVVGRGIGTALVRAVQREARTAGCVRVWLVTTNDNRHAIGFYERRGFRLKAVHLDAVKRARRFKPEIPLIGEEGIPIRDELEFEISL